MKIFSKLFILIVFLVSISVIVALSISNHYITQSKDLLVKKTMEHKKNMIMATLNNHIHQKKDLVEFITTNQDLSDKLIEKDHEWIKDNVSLSTFENDLYHLDFLLLSNLEGDYIDYYADSISTTQFYQSDFWTGFLNDSAHSFTGIDKINDQIILLAATPIYKNNNQNITGYIIVGEYVDDSIFKNCSQTIGHSRLYINYKPIESRYEYMGLHYRLNIPLIGTEDGEQYGLEFFFPAENIEIIDYNHFIIVSIIILLLFLVIFACLVIYFKSIYRVFLKIINKVRMLNKHDYSNLEVYNKSLETKQLSEELNQLAIVLSQNDEKIEQQQIDTLVVINNAIQEKDAYTQTHSDQTCHYAEFIANILNLPHKDVRILKKAALIHDIGKIGIPDVVLNKPGKLTPEEFDLVKSHSVRGYQMLKNINYFKDSVDIILYHHERWDGNGYPSNLKGEDIPKLARILCVADSFHAMTSDRVYQQAFSFDKTLSILEENMSKQFDSSIIKSLLDHKKDLYELYLRLKEND